jgi:LysR family glycine cleavage system transcriptional activator
MVNLRSRLPPLTSLAAFDAVCRHLSFTRAAAELCLTQAAVSRQIIALERHLEVALFERRAHDVALTVDGEKFAEIVNPAINAIGDAAVKIKLKQTNKLTIFSEPCIANYWVTPRISRYQAEYPQTTITLLTSNLLIDDATEVFDIGLQYGCANKKVFAQQARWSDEIIVVACPGIHNQLRKNVKLTDLLDFPFVHTDRIGPGWVSWASFFENFGEDFPEDHTGLLFNNYHSSVDAAIHGAGLLLGWRFVVDAVIGEGKLKQIGDFTIPSPDDQFMYTKRNSPNSKSAKEFIEWVKNDLSATG